MTESQSYYGRPILKEPTWKPEVPVYLFTGGIAGGCAVLHGVARLARNDDLARSIAFYEAAGATQNPKFSDERTMCMVFSETIFVMLLTRERFADFTSRPIADAHATVQALLCLSADSREHVDRIIDATAAAGGSADPNPKQDYGIMYGRSVEDPDGHIWEIAYNPGFALDRDGAVTIPDFDAM